MGLAEQAGLTVKDPFELRVAHHAKDIEGDLAREERWSSPEKSADALCLCRHLQRIQHMIVPAYLCSHSNPHCLVESNSQTHSSSNGNLPFSRPCGIKDSLSTPSIDSASKQKDVLGLDFAFFSVTAKSGHIHKHAIRHEVLCNRSPPLWDVLQLGIWAPSYLQALFEDLAGDSNACAQNCAHSARQALHLAKHSHGTHSHCCFKRHTVFNVKQGSTLRKTTVTPRS